jgi:diaminohydroxyphosphoribosylaminopyrimidine deaminase/5-amino-6-(5-phosphoribosylamino)uracil reductase
VWLGGKDRTQLLPKLLHELATRGCTNVLVEGGAALLGSLFDARLVDELHVFIAPKVIGGSAAVPPVGGVGVAELTEACLLDGVSYELLDGDAHVWGRVRLKTKD